ncbi:MAG: 4-vinyl reductase [Bacteroidetes bacterium]|nr:4-vinyl reductase [Bacteroidota bacterium]
MNPSTHIYYYPNQMARILLLSGDEILGQAGMSAVLNAIPGGSRFVENYPPANQKLEFPFELVAGLQASLELNYGPHGGRGLSMRIGRASFQHGLCEFGPLFGLTDLAFRLLPLKTKLKVGANAFADIFNKHSDQRVRIEDRETHLCWHIERCPVCWGRKTEAPACHLAVGLLQEALYWVSGGKMFNVEEAQCCAVGDSQCSILIDKTPLG